MAKILDNIAEVLFALGAERTAYNFWLKAYRIRQKNGEFDQED